MNFGIIGTNFISDWFVEAGHRCQGFQAQAVCSRTMEKGSAFAQKHGIPDCYDSLEDLAAAENVDAVYIASPTCCHAAQSIQMMKAGKHVICEKPVASNEAELRAMLKAAEENHVVFLEAMKSVLNPAFDAIQANLPKLGKIRRSTFQMCQYSSRYDNYKNGIIENAFRPELSNGSLMDVGVYCVHPTVKLLGKPDRILAAGTKLSNGVDGMGTILAVYEEAGMQAEMMFSKITDSPWPSQIQGEEGTMYIERLPIITKVWIRYRDKREEEIAFELEDPSNCMNYEIAEFMRMIENKESAKEHNQYSIWEMQVMDEARRQIGIVFPADQKGTEE